MDRKPEADPALPAADFNDPDRQNSEQDETGSQAQDVADDALHGDVGSVPESEPGSPPDRVDVVPRDVPDLVETQEGMVRSGRIDMDAFEGEERMGD